VAAPGAQAAATVYGCHTPDGASATTDGWVPNYGRYGDPPIFQPQLRSTIDTCDQGRLGALYAYISRSDFPPPTAGVRAAWVFVAPPATRIVQLQVWRCQGQYYSDAFDSQPAFHFGAGTRITYPNDAGPGTWTLAETYANSPRGYGCTGGAGTPFLKGFDLWDSGQVPGGLPRIWFMSFCARSNCSHPTAEPYPQECSPQQCYTSLDLVAGVWIYAAKATIQDDSPPTVSGATGPLLTGTTHSGTERVTFSATDQGMGLYRAVAQARIGGTGDWVTVASRVPDNNQGKCADAGQSPHDDYEFTSPTPCVTASSNAFLDVDTTRLPVGDHTLRAYVEDASGNRAVILDETRFSVTTSALSTQSAAGGASPPGPVNGGGASSGALIRLARSTQTVRYGKTARIDGRLVDENDDPIRGATIAVDERRLVPKTGLVGPAWRRLIIVETSPTGLFRVDIPAGVSRALRISYRADPARDGFTSAVEARVVVAAGVTIKIRRSRLRNRQSAVFTGKVSGELPKGGVIVTLQAFLPGKGWVPAAATERQVRTKANGTFRMSYRFTATFRRTTYRFRAVVQRDSGFPYAQGASRPVKVTVGR